MRVALEREALLLGDLAPEELDTLVVVLQKLNARVGLVTPMNRVKRVSGWGLRAVR